MTKRATPVTEDGERNAIKFVKDRDDAVEGLGIPYGGPFAGKDIDGEFFSKNTDFCLDWFSERPTLYDHGLDDALKSAVVGRTLEYRVTDDGVWVKAQLDKKNRYYSAIADLIAQDALGFSSGAMPHLVETDRKSGEILRWPWVEMSLTPIPANPLAKAHFVKSAEQAIEYLEAVSAQSSPAAVKAALTALDKAAETGSGSESLDDQLMRVASDAEEVTQRTRKRIELRSAKVGRELSTGNRQWLTSLEERLSALEVVRQEIKELLERTDPETKNADVELFAAVSAAMKTLARFQGVRVD